MRTLLVAAAITWTWAACSVDQEPDVTPSPQTVVVPAPGPAPQTTASPREEPKTRVGVDINRDGGEVSVENDRVDITVGND